ncbi:Mannose-P-dolichol utilization defect 1 protein 2 [Tritrichomonas foetus]|uniref:Mannose-P-dolichol utilization defect 1 protein homolog n=1 Tax=Tritrichomonas foetus TaxID=1144522 RepID=A0A1J4JYN0_9EUKA|nr:Mannose-P-dolichol utilization defect 1 protein 2 [Tritrichomonas foetus]|eukprot:OHT02644.1 Mannose-P-dolichol utilization defect 1 protein 2 [Tritrichomonas foetus]
MAVFIELFELSLFDVKFGRMLDVRCDDQNKRSFRLIIMEFLAWACTPFVSQKCCRAILVDWDFKNSECISLFISKAIGYGLIAFSSILKLPQLFVIIRHKSGQGLSVTSLFMEIVANVLAYCYHRQKGFPISTFGETLLIMIQNVLIAFFVTHYSPTYNIYSWNLFILLDSCLIFAVERGVVSDNLMAMLWTICLPLSIAYKIPQILHTYKAKCKGELSTLSCFLTLMGSCGRVFTTLREVHDWSVLLMYLLNVLLNGTIWVQSMVYPKDRTPFSRLQEYK